MIRRIAAAARLAILCGAIGVSGALLGFATGVLPAPAYAVASTRPVHSKLRPVDARISPAPSARWM